VIRQAISCDICGSEKRQTNHWFVAYDQGGELRVAGWSSRNRLRAGSKHLCGQTCLHKLVDEFMANAISGRIQAGVEDLELPEREAAGPLHDDGESSARLVKPVSHPAPAAPRAWPSRAHPELVPQPARAQPPEDPKRPDPLLDPAASADPAPRFSSQQWRAEAWDRERNRESRSEKSGAAKPAANVAIGRRTGS
jgi:hypothetical protein